MKITELIPKNYYSCQNCGKTFELEETYIIPNLYPVCSFKCKFNIIYHFLKTHYSRENLEFMHKTLKKTPDNYEFKLNTALFDLSKHFSKFTLSNVISVLSFIIINYPLSKKHNLLSFIKLSTPLYDKGVFDKRKMIKFDKREIDKWF